MSEKPASWNCDWHSDPGHEFGLGTGCMNCDDNFAKQQKRFAEERARIERWHATYNAALTGCYAWETPSGAGLTAEQAHEAATEAANLAHGTLVKP